MILCSVLPVFDYPWSPGRNPVENIASLNSMIKEYASQHGHIYTDYFSAMADERMGLKSEYTYDGVHPDREGYRVMEELAEKAIGIALSKD
ncbi:MAG: GDSL-type esterase/lipase family protein [Bacteroidales bacterium]